MKLSPSRLAILAIVTPLLVSCVSTSYTVRPAEIPADLDSFLTASERSVADIIPGDEKHIVWAGKPGEKTPLSLVYIHGWEGSPREYDPVFQQVAAELGANLYFTRLSGYGVNSEAIRGVTVDDWINDALEAFEIGRRIGDRVVVIGGSMGGDLTLWLACQEQPECAAMVLLSCAVQPKDKRSEMMLWPWPMPQILLAAVVGPYNFPKPDTKMYPNGDAAMYSRFMARRYPSVSTMKLMSVVKLTRTLPLQSIRVPSLWLYSALDDAVDIPTLKGFYARAGGSYKRLVHVDGAPSHMLAGDMFSSTSTAEVTGDILSFLRDAGVASRSAAGQ